MTPALAIAWEFRRRYRWGLAAIAFYLVALGVIRLLVLAPGPPVDIERSMSMWFLVFAPLVASFMFLLAVFSFGLDGDFAARPSIYPRRLFTLPVTTSALAGWPMLYGAMAAVGLWLATALLALRPSGVQVPLIWPGLLAVAFLAWIQALAWMPYGLRGLRVIVLMLWLCTAETILMLAMHFHTAERVMVAVLLPHPPIAFFAAVFAVARARRGETPDWLRALRGSGPATDLPAFASPARAQLWLEWRRHGWSLPVLVGSVLPFELALLFIPDLSRGMIFLTFFAVLLTPPFMALFAAATVRQPGLTPFIATRPAASTALIAAKLRMALGSTLAAWVLVLAALPLALWLSGTGPVVIKKAGEVIEIFEPPRAAVFLLLSLLALMASTWKQLVQTLYIGLTGREWAIKTSVAFALALLCAVGPLSKWLDISVKARAVLWINLPWIIAALVCLKMCAAVWVAIRLDRSRLLSDRKMVTGAATWLAAVLALYGVLVWLFSGPLIPRYFLLLVAILAVPLARVSAAPLALAWNRHR